MYSMFVDIICFFDWRRKNRKLNCQGFQRIKMIDVSVFAFRAFLMRRIISPAINWNNQLFRSSFCLQHCLFVSLWVHHHRYIYPICLSTICDVCAIIDTILMRLKSDFSEYNIKSKLQSRYQNIWNGNGRTHTQSICFWLNREIFPCERSILCYCTAHICVSFANDKSQSNEMLFEENEEQHSDLVVSTFIMTPAWVQLNTSQETVILLSQTAYQTRYTWVVCFDGAIMERFCRHCHVFAVCESVLVRCTCCNCN